MEYTMQQARKLGLLDKLSNAEKAKLGMTPNLPHAAESNRGTEETISGTVPRVRDHPTETQLRKAAGPPPEYNTRFPILAEACKKLRDVEKGRTVFVNLALPKKSRATGEVIQAAVLDPSALAVLLEPFDGLLAQMDAEVLSAYFREVPKAIQEWVDATPGLGANNLARLLGEIGHPIHACPYTPGHEHIALPEFHRSKSQLRAYAGNGDVTRQPGRNRDKDQTTFESKQAALLAGGKQWARTRTHVIVQSFVRMNGEPDKNGKARARSSYRDVYDEAKTKAVARGWAEEKRRLPYPANRADQHAYRVTRQCFLDDLHYAAQNTCGCDY